MGVEASAGGSAGGGADESGGEAAGTGAGGGADESGGEAAGTGTGEGPSVGVGTAAGISTGGGTGAGVSAGGGTGAGVSAGGGTAAGVSIGGGTGAGVSAGGGLAIGAGVSGGGAATGGAGVVLSGAAVEVLGAGVAEVSAFGSGTVCRAVLSGNCTFPITLPCTPYDSSSSMRGPDAAMSLTGAPLLVHARHTLRHCPWFTCKAMSELAPQALCPFHDTWSVSNASMVHIQTHTPRCRLRLATVTWNLECRLNRETRFA